MQDIVLELQDMRYLDWALKKIAPRTLGCFLKVYEEAADQKIYYKLSNYDSCRGIFGHECVNELIASRVMKGIRRLDPEWSLRWVQSRIVPYSRQNISEILRVNGMDSYEEQKLLLKMKVEIVRMSFILRHCHRNSLFTTARNILTETGLHLSEMKKTETNPREDCGDTRHVLKRAGTNGTGKSHISFSG